MGASLPAALCGDRADAVSSPLVSFVIPLYNCERYVEQSVRSALSQTVSAVEVVVVDDGSTDNGTERVERIDDERVRLLKLGANHGQAAAINSGVTAARGEYIALLGADDIALPRRVERQVALLARQPSLGMVASAYRVIDCDGAPAYVWCGERRSLAIAWCLQWSNPIGAPTVMMRRSAAERTGAFDTQLRCSEDLEYWGRMAAVAPILQVSEVLTHYRVHPASLMRTSEPAELAETQICAYGRTTRLLSGFTPSEKSLRLLAGLPTEPSVASLHGACHDLWALADGFTRRRQLDSAGRRLLASCVLTDLRGLARGNDCFRHEALRWGSRIVRDLSPSILVAPAWMEFVAVLTAPRRVRLSVRRLRK